MMHFVKAKGILSASNGMNIYRGCTHGCIYCDSRSDCYQMKHDFEDIEVKENAPELLKAKLKSKRNLCMIGTGAMCDPYMHCEDKLKLTRQCLEMIDENRFGICIQTKSAKILRDLDILKSINDKSKAVVEMTLTTFDEKLCKILEPNVSTTKERFEALKIFKENNIPTIVWLCPILPFINDSEENLLGILNMCKQASVKGIICFGMGLTLREGNREYFYKKLDKYFPNMKERYQCIYGNSYNLPSPREKELLRIFHDFCKSNNIMSNPDECFKYMREYPENNMQMSLFDIY